ncbi:hypothetical protein C5167_035336, partial [Papaver somniferum]
MLHPSKHVNRLSDVADNIQMEIQPYLFSKVLSLVKSLSLARTQVCRHRLFLLLHFMFSFFSVEVDQLED